MYEKRTHFRRPLKVPVTCFVEGRKFEAEARDISRGGIFLETRDSSTIPMSAVVGLMFPGDARDQSTFLFGRVARKEDGSHEGVGLSWEKAVSGGNADGLASLLTKMFGISNPKIQVERNHRGERSVFKFDCETSRLNDAKPAGQPRIQAATSRDQERSTHGSPGSSTDGDSVSCYIRGYLEENLVRYPALITRLGPRSALAHTTLKYDPRPMYADLIFSIPSKEGPVEVICKSEARQISAEEPGTVAFRFFSIEEGESRGLLRRYLAWLQLHQN
ncbi:MAG TPA: PilZ domain-containing protein [Myxococcota bacterium]|nr:PilZ domain-containing protein [Myxococcota bacterium]HPV05009.1 PilZ domain-containing protein [Myxococcota bacterium]